MPAFRQSSFAGGELSPTLYGRSDFAKYGSGLKTCRNFFISRHGAAVSRPGTKYVAQTKTLGLAVRLIPFISSDGEAYVLECGHNYVRVYQDGARVGTVELATPWVAADLPHLKYAQSGDVLTVTHHDRTPQEITREDHTTWSIAALDFDVPAYGWAFGQVPQAHGRSDFPPKDADGNDLTQPSQSAVPARKWRYKATQVYRRENGTFYETAPVDITEVLPGPVDFPDLLQLGPEWPLAFVFQEPGAMSANFDQVVATRFYRGRDGLFGYIGSCEGNIGLADEAIFRDEGRDPDYTQAPPKGRNPFTVYDGLGDFVRTEQPTCVGYFEQRQIFAGTVERPGQVWYSRTNDFLNFDEKTKKEDGIPVNSDAGSFETASRKREEIRSILGLDSLLIFTNSSVWATRADGAMGPLNPPAARVQSEVGSSWRDPLVIGDSVLYCRSKGTGVRALGYSNERQGYAGADLSILAEHLFRGYTIDDWAYAEDPWSVVWCVRSDGTLLSLTYDQPQDVWAWATHEIGGSGVVESVCAVPEGTEDAVYLVVRREIDGATVRYIERMTSRIVDDAEDAVCLDSAKTTTSGTPFLTVSGLSHLEGCEVYALCNGSVQGPFTVASGAVTLTEAATRAHVGLRYECELETLQIPEIPADRKCKVTKAIWQVEASRGLWTGQGAGLWAGETPETINEWRQRVIASDDDAIPLHTGKVDVTLRSSWNDHGRVVLKQIDPLPLMVLGVTRITEIGG